MMLKSTHYMYLALTVSYFQIAVVIGLIQMVYEIPSAIVENCY